MGHQFDELSKALASSVSRREVLRKVGIGLVGSMLAGIGVREAAAAPSECAVLCGKTGFTSGPAHAACLQVCRSCEADARRICNIGTGFVCCPAGQTCNYNCQTGRQECCVGDPNCPGSCLETCCPPA